jgi:hypothetical protein
MVIDSLTAQAADRSGLGLGCCPLAVAQKNPAWDGARPADCCLHERAGDGTTVILSEPRSSSVARMLTAQAGG